MNKKIMLLAVGILNVLVIGTASAQQSNSSHSATSVNSTQIKTASSTSSISKIKASLEEKNISDHNVNASISTVNNYVAIKFNSPSNSFVVSIIDTNNHKIITESIPNELKYYSVNIAFLEAGKYSMIIEDMKGLIRNLYDLTITNN